MPSITPSTSTTATRVSRIPYLNSAPFFRGLVLPPRCGLTDAVPRELGERASRGELDAGLLPVVDFFRLSDPSTRSTDGGARSGFRPAGVQAEAAGSPAGLHRFERLGPFGIAVRGRAQSVLLFSRKPIRQLDGAVIAVTDESSTSALLLRLLLEVRYHVSPSQYLRGRHDDADALLLIGDEALRVQHGNRRYPFEIDLAFEWWLWQHLPFVFAVWAIRKDAAPEDKKRLELALSGALGRNAGQLEAIAAEHAPAFGISTAELQRYLAGFIYRLSTPEEESIAQFKKVSDTFQGGKSV